MINLIRKRFFFPGGFSHHLGRAHAAGRGGFSLVEVVLALGITSFSCLTIMGLVSTGMTTLQSSISATTYTTIISRVDSEIQQADFSTFSTTTSYTKYYDDQANDVTTTNPSAAVYKATVTITPQASLPGPSAGNTYVSTNLAVVSVIIQKPNAGANATGAGGATKAYTLYVANQ
jgi:uncharacterized protein (TIGR02598 family)